MTLLKSHTFRQSIPSMFTASKSTWPDPEKSIGRECSKICGLRCWEVTGPALEIINKLSIPIKELLDNHQEILEQGELKPRAVSFHMWMIGSATSTAYPTIVFSSKSRRQRTFAKVLLKESKLLDNYPGIKIKTLDKAPAIYQAADSNLDIDGEEIANDGIYMVDDSRGVCGSLVAFGNSSLATMGGVILIDNVHYGISAQHARFNYMRERQYLASEPADAPCFDDDSDSEYCDLIETTSRGSISSGSDHGYDTDSLTSTGMPADNVFEPPYASSSVDQVGLEVEEMINTKQDRRSCGQRIAHLSANYIQTDLDYELFRLDDPRFHSDNTISLPKLHESAHMLRPGKPARMPSDAAVWVVTGTTGFVRGTMTSTAHYIKMEESRTFQEMWAVRLDRETRPGDCGAWVIDALTGNIYGHIIAGDLSSSVAYIIPAYKVFDDIENRFGVPPSLPSETAHDPIQNRIIQSSKSIQIYTTAPQSSAAAFNFDDRVCDVRLPWTGANSPQIYSPRQEFNRARRRVEFLSSRVEEVPCPRSHLEMLPMKALGNSSNRTVRIEPSWAPSFGQRTRRHRGGISESRLLDFLTREGHSKQVQILPNSDFRAPSIIEPRRMRIPARALNTGVEKLRGSSLLVDLDCKVNFDLRIKAAMLLSRLIRLSSMPSSDSVSLDKNRPGFEINFPDYSRTPCARHKVKSRRSRTGAAWVEISDVESTRFRASINKAPRMVSLASYVTDFSGDPTRHLNKDAKALTSRFDDLLRSRQLTEGRAAYGNSFKDITSLRNYDRRQSINYIGNLKLHVLSDHLPATLSYLEEFLQDYYDAITSSKFRQSDWCHLTATPQHREKHVSGYYNAVAHFEGTLQRFKHGANDTTAVESLPLLIDVGKSYQLSPFEWSQFFRSLGREHQLSPFEWSQLFRSLSREHRLLLALWIYATLCQNPTGKIRTAPLLILVAITDLPHELTTSLNDSNTTHDS